jgi:hypothetical protein
LLDLSQIVTFALICFLGKDLNLLHSVFNLCFFLPPIDNWQNYFLSGVELKLFKCRRILWNKFQPKWQFAYIWSLKNTTMKTLDSLLSLWFFDSAPWLMFLW